MGNFLKHLLIFIAYNFICFGFTNCEFQDRFVRKLPRIKKIVVDPISHSGFSTIQAAINSVPSQNKFWVEIFIKAGVYNEQVQIPQDKPFIYLKGEGMGRTNVVWGAHDQMLTTATFTSVAENIVVHGITFVNSYNYPPNKNRNPVKPALAAMISGDKSAFHECSFLGFQDTLLDDHGRHYFKRCKIEGAIDFIFGGAQSIYEQCMISVNGGMANPVSISYIAAQARSSKEDTGGFVFKFCNVTGTGNTLLGRAWKAYSRAIYYKSFLSDIILPQGWDAWDYVGQENLITFAESDCYGPGSSQSNRVKWERKLSSNELPSFTRTSYVDAEGWLKNLPIRLLD